MQKLFENWRNFRNESLAEKRAGRLVYATDASAGFEKARELDRKKYHQNELGDIIDTNRKKLDIGLAELIEQIIAKITAIGIGVLAGMKVNNYVRKAGMSKITRRFIQRLMLRVAIPGITIILLAEDIYDFVLSPDAKRNRDAIVKDFNKFLYILDLIAAEKLSEP
tara:strand:+ start:230 stop:727 length:498 start_codon:yes stop_codon:yes gene_type:complete